MNLAWFPGPPPPKAGIYLRINIIGQPEIHHISDHRDEFPDMQIGITWGGRVEHYNEIIDAMSRFYWLGPIKVKPKSEVDRLLAGNR